MQTRTHAGLQKWMFMYVTSRFRAVLLGSMMPGKSLELTLVVRVDPHPNSGLEKLCELFVRTQSPDLDPAGASIHQAKIIDLKHHAKEADASRHLKVGWKAQVA